MADLNPKKKPQQSPKAPAPAPKQGPAKPVSPSTGGCCGGSPMPKPGSPQTGQK